MHANISDQIKFAINHAKAIAGFGNRMNTLSEQYQREANHAGASAAATMAKQAHEVIEAAIMTLPEQVNHQKEMQDLIAAATALQCGIADLQILKGDEAAHCSQQEIDWYIYGLHVGQALVMAKHSVERATGPEARQWPSHGLTESNVYVEVALQMAQESLDDMEQCQPPADAPFPQTRQQTKAQAIEDRDEIAAILSELVTTPQ